MKNQEKEQIEWPKLVQCHGQSCELALDNLQELETKCEDGADIRSLVWQLKEQLCEISREMAGICNVQAAIRSRVI